MKTTIFPKGFLISCALTVTVVAVAAPYYGDGQQNTVSNTQRYPGTPVNRYPAVNNTPYTPSMASQSGYPVPVQRRTGNQPAQGYDQHSIYMVHVTPMSSTVKLGGTVIPYKDITLSAQIQGRVEFIAGSEGDYLEQGQVLVAIDDDDLLAQRHSAIAELNNADTSVRNAQVQYTREMLSPQSKNINRSPGMGLPSMFDQFFTRQLGSGMGYGNPAMDRHADLYSRGAAISQAQARVIRARSKLEEVDAKLRDTRAISPFSGLIVKKLVEVGDTVQPGQPMLKFADTKTLQLKVDVPARLMPSIKPGMVVPARLDVGNQYLNVRVAQIFPMADVQRHTVTVKFDLPENVPGAPGMYAEVMITDTSAPASDVILIPASAVRWRGSLPAIYRLDSNGKAELRYVRLGEKVSQDRVTVLSGLHRNDRILANPPANISSGWLPGQPVRPPVSSQ